MFKIFEVARALLQDQSLINEAEELLINTLSNPDIKDAIYQAVKAVNQRLQETEGQSEQFAFTPEEISKLKSLLIT